MWTGFYYEQIDNNFVSEKNNFRFVLNNDLLIYRTCEIGVEIKNKKQGSSFVPFISYINSNGGGLDFSKRYEEFGGGIRFLF